MEFKDQVYMFFQSGFSLINMNTVELERATETLEELIVSFNEDVIMKLDTVEDWLKSQGGLKVYNWNCIEGLSETTGDGKSKPIPQTGGMDAVLRHIASDKAMAGVYLLYNAHFYWNAAPIIELMRQVYHSGGIRHKHVVFIGASGHLPAEIQPYVSVLDFPLPDRETMNELITQGSADFGLKLAKPDIEHASELVQGMTGMEVGSALALAAASTDKATKIDFGLLSDLKADTVKRSGLLEYVKAMEDVADVGGAENFIEWSNRIASVFKNPAKAIKYNLPLLKGCLLVGVPGSGKTLSATILAKLFGVPLFRLDVGRVFGGIVGQTESNYRELFRLIDAISPAVILLDEIDKTLSGTGSSDMSDAGVTDRFIGALLYYMESKQSRSFFAMTANRVSKLPPELMRMGRVNGIWFFDLPVEIEREQILHIHLRKVKRDAKNFNIPQLVASSQGLTGAEIANAISEAMVHAFSEEREFTTEDIEEALIATVPLSKTKGEEIEAMRTWGKERARFANKSVAAAKKDKVRTIIKKEHWSKKEA